MGKSNGQEEACPEGTYRSKVGARSSADCQPCEGGHICGTGTFELNDSNLCPVGYYCLVSAKPSNGNAAIAAPSDDTTEITIYQRAGTSRKALTVGECPACFKCAAGSIMPTPCPMGYYCTGGTATRAKCDDGYFCKGAATSPSCSPGVDCGAEPDAGDDGGIVHPVECPLGHYCPKGKCCSFKCLIRIVCSVTSEIYNMFRYPNGNRIWMSERIYWNKERFTRCIRLSILSSWNVL